MAKTCCASSTIFLSFDASLGAFYKIQTRVPAFSHRVNAALSLGCLHRCFEKFCVWVVDSQQIQFPFFVEHSLFAWALQAVEEGRPPDGGPVKLAEATPFFFAQFTFLFSLVFKCSRHDKVFDLRRCFKSILVKTALLVLFRVYSRLLEVGTPFLPARPRCEAMWLAIAPSVLLSWLQGSKRPHAAVREGAPLLLFAWEGVPFHHDAFLVGNMAELPTVWSCTSPQSESSVRTYFQSAPISSSEMSKFSRTGS